jgi:hypothetical protein
MVELGGWLLVKTPTIKGDDGAFLMALLFLLTAAIGAGLMALAYILTGSLDIEERG